ncbi:anion permease [Enterobacter hormaechei]
MKTKTAVTPAANLASNGTAKRLLMMALPVIVAVLLSVRSLPDGLPPYAWHYFAIFVGVIVGLIFEPLPGAVIGLTGVVAIALCSQWVLFSPEQLADPKFKLAGAPSNGRSAGLVTPPWWPIFGAFMFAAGYDKTRFGRRLALILAISGLSQPDARLRHYVCGPAAAPLPRPIPRSGGTVYPIIANLPPLYGSKPNDPSARKIGSYRCGWQLPRPVSPARCSFPLWHLTCWRWRW